MITFQLNLPIRSMCEIKAVTISKIKVCPLTSKSVKMMDCVQQEGPILKPLKQAG